MNMELPIIIIIIYEWIETYTSWNEKQEKGNKERKKCVF